MGMDCGNEEMCKHYKSKVEVRFHNIAEQHGQHTENFAVMKGEIQLVKDFFERGADFQSKNKFGMGALATFCAAQKDLQLCSDVGILDFLHEKGCLTDLNERVFTLSNMNCIMKTNFFRIFHMNRFRNKCCGKPKLTWRSSLIWYAYGGTALHLCVYRDKPQVVAWLLKNQADPNLKNKRGITPLALADELEHDRCWRILLPVTDTDTNANNKV